MRVISSLVIMLVLSMNGMAQTTGIIVERNNNGVISSVKYLREDKNETVPENAAMFFTNVLKVRNEDTFKLQHSRKAKYGMSFERYVQFYQGIEVDGGFYSFRYKNGRMLAASGNYISTKDINITPSITEGDAKSIFGKYMKEKIRNLGECHIKLVITEKPNNKETVLAYIVYFETTSIFSSEIGYIDAHTGNLIYTLPASICYSALGTFYTLYNNDSTKMARTEYIDGNTGYILYDTTRGNGIHTYNGTSNTSSDFSDTNNIWTASELGNCQMALDVHWTLQQIYDVLKYTYGHNSFNDANAAINAYIISGKDTGFNYVNNKFYYGQGNNVYGPMASVDIIGHEFGHAILHYITNWQNKNSDRGALHEGFGDIWGLLFEHHITPNADIWKTGEDVMIGYSCERDFAYPNNPNAHTKIADTYNYGLYNTGDEHVRGGIAAHWFHLLVNGGSGTNEKNDTYTVYPVGLDSAEELFTYTVLNNSYLDNYSTFVQVRQAFVDAANDMNNPFLAMQVENAWYAVGVGTQPIQIEEISGSSILCDSTIFTINNLTSDLIVTWHFEPNYSALDSLIHSDYPALNQCTITTGNGVEFSAILQAIISVNGVAIDTLSKAISTPLCFYGTYSQTPEFHNKHNYPTIPETSFYDEYQFIVNPDCDIVIKSEKFRNMSISSNVSNIGLYKVDDETITFNIPYIPTATHFHIYATSANGCGNFSFLVSPIYIPLNILNDIAISFENQNLCINLPLLDDKMVMNKSFQKSAIPQKNRWYITITNVITGQTVYIGNPVENNLIIDTANWNGGVYAINFTIDNVTVSKKVNIRKQ